MEMCRSLPLCMASNRHRPDALMTPSYTCNVARGRILTYDLLDNVHPVYHERISYTPSCYVPPVGFEPTTCGLKVRSSDQTELKGLNTQPATGM